LATDDRKKSRRRPAGEREREQEGKRGAGRGAESEEPAVPVRRRPLSNEARELLRQWGEEACAAYELVLWDMDALERGGVWLVRYFVDRVGGIGPGKGVTLEECTLVNRYLITVIDADERMPTAYELEVSSPGIERDLKRPDHWTSMVGQKIRAIVREPQDGKAMWEGVLVGMSEDGSSAQLKVAGETVSVPLSGLKRAHIKYDFGTTAEPDDEA
jgi:ribosome maturation factor RimP